MADAITTFNPTTPLFIVNKYDDIDGSRVSQQTPRGRLCFVDTDGRMTVPRTAGEAAKAVFPVDWAKPLNPPPYYDGPGLNGGLPGAFNDGSLGAGENSFSIDEDTAFTPGWPIAYKIYDVPPQFLNVPVTSGNKCLIFDAGVFTYTSGNYVGTLADYTVGAAVYVAAGSAATTGGMVTASGSGSNVGHVYSKEVFGTGTLTVKLKGSAAL